VTGANRRNAKNAKNAKNLNRAGDRPGGAADRAGLFA
jgi:hypothetical protein